MRPLQLHRPKQTVKEVAILSTPPFSSTTMIPRLLPLALSFIASALTTSPISTRAEDPREFIELGKGVEHAKEGKRLVLFLLVQTFADETDAILKAINEELAGKGHEFVIVRCQNESAEHRKLFKERFKQDPDKMPLGVVTKSSGEIVTGTNGKSPEAYRIMILASRIQAGYETDSSKIAALNDAIMTDEEAASTVFGIKRSDIEVTKQLITKYRDWRFRDGRILKAALLEANGPKGTFILVDGKEVEVDFDSLSDADKGYLTIILGGNEAP